VCGVAVGMRRNGGIYEKNSEKNTTGYRGKLFCSNQNLIYETTTITVKTIREAYIELETHLRQDTQSGQKEYLI